VVQTGLRTALVGVVLAVLGAAPLLLMGVVRPEDDASDAFDGLLGLGWAPGGVLAVGGLLVAALGAALRRRPW
jgi:hypothetical protein